MNKKALYSAYPLLFTTSFICGGTVMAIELISAKLIASFYGNSLYVWSAVLAITLGGLALGYFIGGFYSTHTKRKIALLLSITMATISTVLMPQISSYIMEISLSISIKSGIITSCFAFIFLPLFCFGMVSPLIIGIIEQKIKEPGRVSGIVYSISTTGGILFTFLTGYYFIPTYGLKNTCFLLSIFLAGCILLVHFSERQPAKINPA